MEFSSVGKKPSQPVHDSMSGGDSSTKSCDWKGELASKLRTTRHERSDEFEDQITSYLDGRQPNLSRLVCGCMAHREREVLHQILVHEDIKNLCIRGPVDQLGWDTLIAAMPATLSVEMLKLSTVRLSHSKCERLFQVLGRMPKLEKLSLKRVDVETSLFLGLPDCPALALLKSLDVFVDVNAEASPLLLKILEACHLRSLSIRDHHGATTVVQHEIRAKMISKQTDLNSLRLAFSARKSAKQVSCYMKFLCGETKLIELHLNAGCEVADFNRLIEALPRKSPLLTSLSLIGCCPIPPRIRQVEISPLAGMSALQHLNLRSNYLEDATVAELLVEWEGKPTRLRHLNLSGNWIGPTTLVTAASFLETNRTLVGLSIAPLGDRGFIGYQTRTLELLSQALENNTCLQQLDLRWPDVVEPFKERLINALERNKEGWVRSVIQGHIGAVLDTSFPIELAALIAGRRLTVRDALSLSSVNKAGWERRWSQG